MIFDTQKTTQNKPSNWFSKDFEPNKAYKYTLAVELTDTSVDFCVADAAAHKLMAIKSVECTPDTAAAVFLDDTILNVSDYKSVVLQIFTSKFLIIPEDYYKEKITTDHFKIHFEIDTDTDLRTEKVRLIQARNLYLLPRNTLRAANGIYKKVQVRHHLTTLIDDLVFFNQTNLKKTCYVNVRHQRIDVMVIEAEKLHYANQFEAHTPEDALYYLLQLVDVLQITDLSTPIVLMGNIKNMGGDLAGLLANFFGSISLIKRTRLLKIGKEFDGVPAHEHYSLLAAACV